MEKAIRNLIQRATQDSRQLIEREYSVQLAGTFDILPDGSIPAEPGSHLDDSGKLTREKIIAAIEFERAKGSSADSVAAYLREAAFTTVNRFVALKMLEARDLVQECISRGEQSNGFKEFSGLAPGLVSLPDHGYRLYIESLFDEIGREIRVLFDRHDPASLLWPRRQALTDLLAILNNPELASVWSEDETIGWVYQYFNSQDERRAMREASQAPRDGWELAVRNQFFTPRYVVEFLTDNTLGRTWYEMRQGVTTLKEKCRYLVRRSDEVFLSFHSGIADEENVDKARGAFQFVKGSPKGFPPFDNSEQSGGRLADMAHCVDCYARHPHEDLVEGERWIDWAKKQMDQSESLESFSAQDLIDVLFGIARADQHGGGLDHLVERPGILRIGNEVRERILRSRKENLTREELLKAPVLISFRERKDPRDIRVLDPACGSGHFLLYAFDLLETIYEEAWHDKHSIGSEATRKSLREDFPELENLRREIPRLILECNLHGIDIDPRAVQIASLALWMLAQKAWNNQGLSSANRPRVLKTNIVTAEPMPGDRKMLDEFVGSLEGEERIIGELVRVVWDRMKMAGEAGSLLRIEEELREEIESIKSRWEALHEGGNLLRQGNMFRPTPPRQTEIRTALAKITRREFWEEAEDLITQALNRFSQSNGALYRRKMFVDDAAQGIAFIDLCRKKYDIVLMNPPFGDASIPSKQYIEEVYGDTKGDVFKTFVECFQDRLVPSGLLGIISSRTGFFLSQSADWRERVVLRLFRPLLLADLGHGVLDAMVETAAYVLRNLTEQEDRALTLSLLPHLRAVPLDRNGCFSIPKYRLSCGLKRHQAESELAKLVKEGYLKEVPGQTRRFMTTVRAELDLPKIVRQNFPQLVCFRLIRETDKGARLAEIVQNTLEKDGYVVNPSSLQLVPHAPFAYWVTDRIRKLFKELPPFEGKGRTAKQGLATADDFRFIRAWWEIPVDQMGTKWFPFAKGGEYSQFYSDIHLAVNWSSNGAEIRSFEQAFIRNEDFYFRPGITWPLRTDGLSFRCMPSGSVFGHKGPGIFFSDDGPLDLLSVCAILNSRAFNELISIQLARTELAQSYEVGLIQQTPLPELDEHERSKLGPSALKCWAIKRDLDEVNELSHAFVCPKAVRANGKLLDRSRAWDLVKKRKLEQFRDIQIGIDATVQGLYGFEMVKPIERLQPVNDDRISNSQVNAVAELLSWCLGVSFGRWDIRIQQDRLYVPKVPSPFDSYHHCPPGMLVNPTGLPAGPSQIVSEEWLRARLDANSVSDADAVTNTTITDSEYPLSISWQGILVDDTNPDGISSSSEDIVLRVREVFDVLWGEKSPDIENEACEIMGVQELREYFRKPTGFFSDHIKRCSKSRRKAPIYWQLATPSASYSVWLYYHRFTKDTFYKVLNDYVDPKLREIERRLTNLRQDAGPQPTTTQLKEIAREEQFVEELRTFRDEIAIIAPLWNPNLNDGVIINFAPLWRLVPQHRQWQKECKECWDKLFKGDYDWAYLAMHLWPERVIPKCARDRSLAIAHGVNEIFWEQDKDGKWHQKKVAPEIVQKLIRERTSASVKDALDKLLSLPSHAVGPSKSRTSRTKKK